MITLGICSNNHHFLLIFLIKIFPEAGLSENDDTPTKHPPKDLATSNESHIIDAIKNHIATIAKSVITPNDIALKTSSGN